MGSCHHPPVPYRCSFRAWLTRRAAVLTATAALLTEPKRASCGRQFLGDLGSSLQRIHVCPMHGICLFAI